MLCQITHRHSHRRMMQNSAGSPCPYFHQLHALEPIPTLAMQCIPALVNPIPLSQGKVTFGAYRPSRCLRQPRRENSCEGGKVFRCVPPRPETCEIRLSEEARSREVGNKCLMIGLNKSVGSFSSYLLVIDVRNCSHEPYVICARAVNLEVRRLVACPPYIASSLASPEKAKNRIMDS